MKTKQPKQYVVAIATLSDNMNGIYFVEATTKVKAVIKAFKQKWPNEDDSFYQLWIDEKFNIEQVEESCFNSDMLVCCEEAI